MNPNRLSLSHNSSCTLVLGKNFQKTEDLGGKGVGRSEGMKDKCKVGSLNIFLHSDYLLTITKYWQQHPRNGDLRWLASSSFAAPAL